MDYTKIGKFIAEERKSKKLTQAKLAEKLFVSEKTVSKWENGKGVPDTSILTNLCEIFGVSINELLNGERLSLENYNDKAEQMLLDLRKEKEQKDKMLLSMEIVAGCLSVIIVLVFSLLAKFLSMQEWLRIVLIVSGFVIALSTAAIALKIEQVAGYYVCGKCGYKYIPSYDQVFFAMHMGRTRHMRCPKCKQKSWNRKVIK